MFRLAVTTDEIDDDLVKAVAFLQAYGIKYCEIRELWDQYNTSLPLEKIREARSILDDAGISLAVLDTSFFKTSLPESRTVAGDKALGKQWDLLERAFERAEILGTKLIRSFAFTYKRVESPNQDFYPRIYELAAELAERAQNAGYRLAVENVADSYVSTAADSASLLKAVQNPSLGLKWDPNNSARAGGRTPFPDGYRMLDSKRILHVHFRDYRRLRDGSIEWCGVGDDEFDHVGQLRVLLSDNYQGVIWLETHYSLDGSKEAASIPCRGCSKLSSKYEVGLLNTD